MSKSPLLLGLSLWLVLGTCTSAVGMKPFLPGIPSSGTMWVTMVFVARFKYFGPSMSSGLNVSILTPCQGFIHLSPSFRVLTMFLG